MYSMTKTLIRKTGLFERLTERVSGHGSIERENGIIRDVRIVGLVSKNGRRYLREALTEAVPLYEGSKVFIDHVVEAEGRRDRPKRERWGVLRNVRQVQDGSLVGDLHYTKSHPDTEWILEQAERFEDFGLSHDADGALRREKNGETVCYKIGKVHSVDVVENPATNRNLHESENPPMKKRLLATLREHAEKLPTAGLLLTRVKEMGDALYPETMELSGDLAAEASPEDEVKEALATTILAIINMEGKTPEETLATIRTLLEVKAEVVDGKTNPSEPEADPAMKESIDQVLKALGEIKADNQRLREEVNATKAQTETERLRESCRTMLRDANREPLDARVNALMAVKESERASLIEQFAPIASKPAYSRSRESVAGDDLKKVDGKEGMMKLLGVGGVR